MQPFCTEVIYRCLLLDTKKRVKQLVLHVLTVHRLSLVERQPILLHTYIAWQLERISPALGCPWCHVSGRTLGRGK
jgi:hypothetical protein